MSAMRMNGSTRLPWSPSVYDRAKPQPGERVLLLFFPPLSRTVQLLFWSWQLGSCLRRIDFVPPGRFHEVLPRAGADPMMFVPFKLLGDLEERDSCSVCTTHMILF